MQRPVQLSIGAALALLEGLALLGYAVLEVVHADRDHPGVAVTTALFFALVGGALVWCARGLWRSDSWARSPVVVIQLITLLTAWSFRGGETATTVVAVVLAVVSVTALVCLLHPRSIEALAGDRAED